MDNITHTLIGTALAETGLRRRTRYATAALMIGANMPDVDVIAVPLGHSLGWRRGITHGVPAMIIWPLVLTGLILLWHRWRRSRMGPRAGAAPGGRHEGDRPPVRAGQLVLLSGIAVFTHPLYDWLNNYGLRWLMPFDGTWFYGDSLFIVDPYLLAALVCGVVLSRRRVAGRAARPFMPGRLAVAAGGLYTILMAGLHEVAERAAARSFGSPQPGRVMVAPTAANPFRWLVVADRGSYYERGYVRLLHRPRYVETDSIAIGLESRAVHAASRHPDAAEFLGWSRWPFYRVQAETGLVTITDLRYASPSRTGGWASVTVGAPP